MEWVKTSGGRLPQGRRLVEGGYEENGGQLYHACASIHGIDVPGKTAEHLVRFPVFGHSFIELMMACIGWSEHCIRWARAYLHRELLDPCMALNIIGLNTAQCQRKQCTIIHVTNQRYELCYINRQ
jgi:hypothetical protein